MAARKDKLAANQKVKSSSSIASLYRYCLLQASEYVMHCRFT